MKPTEVWIVEASIYDEQWNVAVYATPEGAERGKIRQKEIYPYHHLAGDPVLYSVVRYEVIDP